MRMFIWIIGLLLAGALVVIDIMLPAMHLRWIYPLLLAAFLPLVRVIRGPTIVDRTAALNLFGVLFAGFCGVAAVVGKWDIFIDIAIAWTIQSFIVVLALAKYAEGKRFDD